MTTRFPIWTLSILLAGACAPREASEGPVELETEDIVPEQETAIDLTADKKAAPRAKGGGQLPGTFPEGMPVFEPSSISDLGDAGLGDYVQFVAAVSPGEVESWYRSALARAGWSVEDVGEGVMIVARGGVDARVSLEKSGPATFIRIDY